ncbi:MAG: PEP-CTERM sorting domain-containing protein [Planctomycetota bacterium]
MIRTAFVCIATLTLNTTSLGSVLIDFDGDLILDAGTALRAEDIGTATQRGFSFDDSASGQFFSSSYGQAEFSGGVVLGTGPDGVLASSFGVALSPGDDRWVANTNGRDSDNNSTNTVIDAFLVFRKDQFLGGGDTLDVAFDSSTTITTSVGALGRTQRVAVKQGGQWYLSEASTSGGNFSLTDFNNNAAAGKGWAAINPTGGDFDVLEDTAGLSFGAIDFTAVEAVASVVQANRGGSGNFVQLNDFTVEGVVLIPEPSSLLLIAAGGACMLTRRRQRTNRP